jgi:hypothetical protein
LGAVKSELDALGVLEFAQIAWHDPREGVYRMVHSGPGSLQFDIPTAAEHEAERDFVSLGTLADALNRARARQSPNDTPGQ